MGYTDKVSGWDERVWLEAAVRCEPVIRLKLKPKECRAHVLKRLSEMRAEPPTLALTSELTLLKRGCAICRKCPSMIPRKVI